jgi:hypothetical protein
MQCQVLVANFRVHVMAEKVGEEKEMEAGAQQEAGAGSTNPPPTILREENFRIHLL